PCLLLLFPFGKSRRYFKALGSKPCFFFFRKRKGYNVRFEVNHYPPSFSSHCPLFDAPQAVERPRGARGYGTPFAPTLTRWPHKAARSRIAVGYRRRRRESVLERTSRAVWLPKCVGTRQG